MVHVWTGGGLEELEWRVETGRIYDGVWMNTGNSGASSYTVQFRKLVPCPRFLTILIRG
jgi:hypothetical protein